jgi:hypothetical protein
LRYHHDSRTESFGEEAVAELAAVEGVEAEQVYKTLVIAVPKGLAVAVLPVPAKLSLKAAAAALGVSKAAMADRAAAEHSTGYVIGAALGPRVVQRRQTRLGRHRAPAGSDPADRRGHRRDSRVNLGRGAVAGRAAARHRV